MFLQVDNNRVITAIVTRERIWLFKDNSLLLSSIEVSVNERPNPKIVFSLQICRQI